jgi:hypothetical protein
MGAYFPFEHWSTFEEAIHIRLVVGHLSAADIGEHASDVRQEMESTCRPSRIEPAPSSDLEYHHHTLEATFISATFFPRDISIWISTD